MSFLLFRQQALALAVATCSFTPISSLSHADTGAEPVPLERIIVTATRSPQAQSSIPARVEVIAADVIKQSPLTTLPQLLQQNTSLNVVQSGGLGQQTSVFTRGSNSNQTLILRDGVRLNTASSGLASLPFLDITDLQRIEVLKGPASVLYGTDAIGGVVQLIGQTPRENAASLTIQGGEHQTVKTVIAGDLRQDQLFGQLRAQRTTTNGTPVTDRNHAQPAGFDQGGISARLGVQGQYYDTSVDFWGNRGVADYENFSGKLISQAYLNQSFNVRGRLDPLDGISLHGRWSQFGDDLDQRHSTDYVHATTRQLEGYATWQVTPAQQLLMGVTRQQLKGEVLSFGSPYADTVDSTGYFAQHQWRDQRINTQVGIRLEDHDKYGTHTVGQGAIRYALLPATSIYANIGSAFRSPTLNDLYGYGGNQQLKPETALSYELGIDQKLGNAATIGLNGFHNKVKQLISLNCIATCDGDSVYQNININSATLQGAEAYARWQSGPWHSRIAYQFVQATDDATGKALLRRPRHTGSLSAGWQGEQWGSQLSLAAKSRSKDFAQDNPGYVTIDLNGYWQALPTLRLFANVENVADTRYKTANADNGVNYINGGRLASLGATLQY